MSLRICLITPELPPFSYGGIGQYVLTLARQLDRLGHRVTVAGFRIHPDDVMRHDWGTSVALRSRVDAMPAWGRSAVRTVEQQLSRLEQAMPLDQVPFAWRLGMGWKLRGIVSGAVAVRDYLTAAAGNFDVIEMPNYPGHGALAPTSVVAPYVVRLSTPAAEAGSTGNVYITSLEKRVCAKARLIIANSRAMSVKAASVYGLPSDGISIIPHGLDDLPAEQIARDNRRMVLTYCGRAEPRKGTDLLLQALRTVMPEHPALVVRFVRADLDRYVADFPEFEPVWRELTARFGDRIECVGTVSDETRNRMLASSDWTVIPSRFESFGLVAVESMRAGTPVIATDAGGLGEVCRMSPGNIVCETDSVVHLTSALRAACDEGKAAAAGRGRLSRECFLTYFQSAQMAESTVKAYEQLVA